VPPIQRQFWCAGCGNCYGIELLAEVDELTEEKFCIYCFSDELVDGDDEEDEAE
jgi:pyruvate/2-oxoacid:ferredoxin oxidoreductase beta subunit